MPTPHADHDKLRGPSPSSGKPNASHHVRRLPHRWCVNNHRPSLRWRIQEVTAMDAPMEKGTMKGMGGRPYRSRLAHHP